MADKTKRKAEDERTRKLLADYLASTAEPEKPVAQIYRNDPAAPRGLETAEVYPDRVVLGRRQDVDRAALEDAGYNWQAGDDYALQVANTPAKPPPGKLPFMLGGNEVHAEGDPAPLAGAASKAADMARSLRTPPEPQVEVSMGKPQIVSRKRAPRPQFQVGKAGQVDATSTIDRALAAGRGRALPPGLHATAMESPEVAAHLIADDDELLGAQESARLGTRNARLARALSMVNESISGAKYDRNAYDQLEQDSSRPVSDLLQRRQQKRVADQDAAARGAEQYGREKDSRDFKYRQGRDLATDERENARDKNMAEYRKEELRQQGLNRAESRAERAERRQASQAEINERARLAREQKQGATNEKDLQELAKRSQSSGAMKDDLETINRYIERGGDLPGVGPLAGRLPELFVSAEGTELRQAATRAVQNLIYQKSGKAITEQEAQRVMAGNGMGTGQSETAFKKGMQALAREMQTALRDTESGFRPEIVKERNERGGTTSSDLPGPAAIPTGKTITMNDGSVWAVLDNGKARRIR